MNVSIEINQKDLDKLNNNLDGIGKSLTFKKPLKKSLEYLKEEAIQNFDQGGRIYGKWKPLAESTRRQRSRLGYGSARPILVRTGQLKNNFTVTTTPMTGKITNSSPVAAFHQFGGNKIPQRKILDVTTKWRTTMGVVFSNYISSILKKFA